MTTHTLKTLGEYFDAVAAGRKTFELRLNDRDFQVGDELELIRYVLHDRVLVRSTVYPPIRRKVTYILHGPAYGLQAGWCIMGLDGSVKV